MIDFDGGTADGAVGLDAAGRARHEAAQFHFRFRHDLDPRRLAAGDEFVDLTECARMKRGLAMIDGPQHQIGRALQRRTIRGNAGRRARLADKAAVGLSVFVHAVAAQRQERGAINDLALACIEPAQERTAAVEFVAEVFIPIIDAMIGNTAQHGMAHVSSAAVLDIKADRIAAARIANQGDARGARACFQFLDGVCEFTALVLGRGAIFLLDLVVGPRQGIGEVDRKHPLARHAVRFHPPHRGDPQRRMVAIAVHEQDRRDLAGPRRRGLGERRKAKIPGQQRQGPGTPKQRSSRHSHDDLPLCFQSFSYIAKARKAPLGTGQDGMFAGIN